MRQIFSMLGSRRFATAFTIVAACAFILAVRSGAAHCPPNADTCIFIALGVPDADGYSKSCEVVTGNGGQGIGWQYKDDYAFTGTGDVPFLNKVPGTVVNKNRRQVEYHLPDCPDANNPAIPARFPSTAKVAFPLSVVELLNFNTRCVDPPVPTTP
jgi:hypothetical protein